MWNQASARKLISEAILKQSILIYISYTEENNLDDT